MNRLKELREDNDLLQKDIAKEIGLTQRNYSYYETEQTMLTADVLISLANYYETSIDYLLYETDERKRYKRSIMKEEVIRKTFSKKQIKKFRDDIDKLIKS